jgi:hypothetical protein
MFELRAHILADRPLTVDEAVQTLNWVNLCTRHNCLPKAGGLFDQDSLLVFVMEHVEVWQDERQRREHASGTQHSGAIPRP